LEGLDQASKMQKIKQIVWQFVPFLATCEAGISEYNSEKCQLKLKNQPKVQNNFGGIQAGAIFTTIESAMALVIDANLPEGKIVVSKNARIEYLRKCKGDIWATAELTEIQTQAIRQTEKGTMTTEGSVSDETGEVVVKCTVEWVWHPIKK
jgi:uncharacterized protein (TIGR00369 family)